jgi:uncharacterized protein (DUF3820 family)
MPFGKYRGKRLADVARDFEYVDWLLARSWFESRYPVLFERFQSDPLLIKIRDVEKENLCAAEKRARQLRASRKAMQRAREARWEQMRLDRHIVEYNTRGIWPFGKYKGQPLVNVAHDDAYCRWFKGTAYAKANPELTADLEAMIEAIATRKTATTAVELHDGGCVVYRPTIWFQP